MQAIQTRTLSPKETAQIIGVSESSIKRWVDDGLIEVIRTAGGHRRILTLEVLRFVRQQEMRVLRPDLLGLPDIQGLSPEAREGALTGETLFHLLVEGEASKVRGIIANSYLTGTSLGELFDGPLAAALTRFGEQWKHGEEGIYLEHMATNVCIEAINQIRTLIPPAGPDAPLALGGSPEGDPYVLPSLMAAAVLADVGYREINLGANTPWGALRQAAEDHAPNLLWVAVTSHLDDIRLDAEMETLMNWLKQQQIAVVAGGRGALLRRDVWPEQVYLGASMTDLANYARKRLELYMEVQLTRKSE